MIGKTEARALINAISADCYYSVQEWVKENWRRAIPEPVDTYVTYNTKFKDDIAALVNDGYENELYAELEKSANDAITSTVI